MDIGITAGDSSINTAAVFYLSSWFIAWSCTRHSARLRPTKDETRFRNSSTTYRVTDSATVLYIPIFGWNMITLYTLSARFQRTQRCASHTRCASRAAYTHAVVLISEFNFHFQIYNSLIEHVPYDSIAIG